MSITLNLLPQDKIISGNLAKFLKISRVLSVVFLFIFIVYAVGSGVMIYMNSVKINKLSSENSDYSKKISELKASEQQIILIKDRIKKIDTVMAIPSALKNLSNVISLISNLTEKSRVTELSADSKKVDLSVNFKTNADMVSFTDLVRNTNLFKSVTIGSYGLNPTTGYLISFSLINSK